MVDMMRDTDSKEKVEEEKGKVGSEESSGLNRHGLKERGLGIPRGGREDGGAPIECIEVAQPWVDSLLFHAGA